MLDWASEVCQATITGEPLPVPKEPGDEVFAGTLNGTGALRIKVERDASDSAIARIVRMVQEASETKAPTQLFIGRSNSAIRWAWRPRPWPLPGAARLR
ncbi:hypothetical protein SPURM210S_07640 [Streptomyces purpurascens]